MPPAPTRPSTTEERVAYGSRNDRHAACPDRAQRFLRVAVRLFHRFGKKPAAEADLVDHDRKRARKRSEPDRDDENQRPNEVGNGPEQGDQRARRVVENRVRRQMARGEDRERQAQRHARRSTHQRHLERFQQRPADLGQPVRRGRKHLADDAHDIGNALHEFGRRKSGPAQCGHEQRASRHPQHEGEQAGPFEARRQCRDATVSHRGPSDRPRAGSAWPRRFRCGPRATRRRGRKIRARGQGCAWCRRRSDSRVG